ncbi:sensor histidine kinase [Flavihumibacter stibioxidans]
MQPSTMQAPVRLKDTWFRILGIPFIALMSHVIFFNEQHGQDEKFSFWQVFLISLAEGVVLWETNRLVLLYFHRRYPALYQSRQRLLGIFAGCMAVTIVVRYLNIWIYDKTLFWGYIFPPEGYWYNILIALLYVVIVAGLYEGIFYFYQWKSSFAETEALKRENLQTQLDSLKAQVNPHFLFNNLSSLSSLVMEDQKKAVEFIGELASVYRYVLQSNDSNLTTVSAELEFIHHYFHLLKTRFDEGLQLNINIGSDYLGYGLPPLTLQLLVENAVKHNVILPESPLIIKIYTDEADNLVVINNLQKKSAAIETGKLGLSNIIAKYRLMGHRDVMIKQTEDVFQVLVPLIKMDSNETTDSRR